MNMKMHTFKKKYLIDFVTGKSFVSFYNDFEQS